MRSIPHTNSPKPVVTIEMISTLTNLVKTVLKNVKSKGNEVTVHSVSVRDSIAINLNLIETK